MSNNDVIEHSVKVIQHTWLYNFKKITTKKIIKDFLDNGPAIQKIKSINFKELIIFLKEKKVIDVTKKCLQRIHLASISLYGNPNNITQYYKINIKIFLTSYIVVYNQRDIFENIGTYEQKLIDIAKPLIKMFEKICKNILNSKITNIYKEITNNFISMLYEYFEIFQEWKKHDKIKLILQIQNTLDAFYKAQLYLPSNEPENSKLRIELKTQIVKLRSKLQLLGGIEILNQYDEKLKNRDLISIVSNNEVYKQISSK